MIAISTQQLPDNNLLIGPFGWYLYILLFGLYMINKLTNLLYSYLHMLYDVVFLIYTGSFMSLQFFTLVKKQPNIDISRIKNAWLKYPIYALIVLLLTFFALYFLGRTLVNSILTIYFSYLSICSFRSWFDELFSRNEYLSSYKHVTITIIKRKRIRVSQFDLVCIILSSIITLIYLITRDWTLNNILGISFCLYGLKSVQIIKLSLGILMLILL